ncbi:MAG TPA: protein kinase [Kamptonema sp.]|nr:protein kinase [Kamptonema sp.]
MQPPIPVGTTLQNRYRLLSILGQGGFGRTYLAEDRGRFQERCALKEFIPIQSGTHAIEKSKELFQREAAVLYQIQHPQIPQFRATFEESQRLFLVQDYVDGKTYRRLLQEFKATGRNFLEAEVLVFVRQMLPVLAHIHARGIIHRDISPDNIILRNSDQLPVLIDFGVVKELATRVQGPDPAGPATSVGKIGYAPAEQMQTGRATPSSDLYALAVTAIVLLTGKEPQELLDENTLIWNWQRWTQVSLGFAYVLNRMLSRQPSDRYQSVSEVAQALEGQANPSFQPQQPPPISAPIESKVSQVATVAVGRKPDAASLGAGQQHKPAPIAPPPDPFWDNPMAATVLGAVLVLLTGFGSWALVSSFLNSQKERPSPKPSVFVTPTPEPILSPRPTPKPELTPSPTPKPIPIPTPEPSLEPTLEPSPEPSLEPSPEPTLEPSPEPSLEPSPEPTLEPSPEPKPSPKPEPRPSPQPTPKPTPSPKPEPKPSPTPEPKPSPTPEPTPTPKPEPTPTPEPIPTPTPEPIPTPTPEPTPSNNPAEPESSVPPSPPL